jgi:hypothetical protein
MKTSVLMRCPMCEQTSELDNLHLLDRSFKLKWEGLTDEEQSFIYDQVKQIVNSKPFWVRFADAIEAKLRELNT